MQITDNNTDKLVILQATKESSIYLYSYSILLFQILDCKLAA